MKPGPTTGWLLFGLLLISAIVTLYGDRAPFIPPSWQLAGPAAFGIFLVVFAVYRFSLVRAGRYPAGKAAFQVGLGAIFLALVLGRRPTTPEVQADLPALLANPDREVRRLACEVARYRSDGARLLPLLERQGREDPDPVVRERCQASARALRGMPGG